MWRVQLTLRTQQTFCSLRSHLQLTQKLGLNIILTFKREQQRAKCMLCVFELVRMHFIRNQFK